jgi:hypothetical protein
MTVVARVPRGAFFTGRNGSLRFRSFMMQSCRYIISIHLTGGESLDSTANPRKLSL